jgi:hypothetical protein
MSPRESDLQFPAREMFTYARTVQKSRSFIRVPRKQEPCVKSWKRYVDIMGTYRLSTRLQIAEA